MGPPVFDPLTDEQRAFATRLFETLGLARKRPLVAVHPSGGRLVKQWDVARWAAVGRRLQEEHVAIHEVLERVDGALVAFVSGPDGAKALASAVDLLTDTLLSHLSYEERELVGPLSRVGFF